MVMAAALQSPMEGIVTEEGEGLFRFAFDGTLTTQSGVEAQRAPAAAVRMLTVIEYVLDLVGVTKSE